VGLSRERQLRDLAGVYRGGIPEHCGCASLSGWLSATIAMSELRVVMRCLFASAILGATAAACGSDEPTSAAPTGTLFDSLRAVAGLTDVVRFQHQLTSAILEGESHKRDAGKDKEKRALFAYHLHACRTYGDALAWRYLHPHAIRQLAKNQGRPPHLGGQLASVAAALEVVEGAAKHGFPAIVSDLTHCLRIGDVIVVAESGADRNYRAEGQ
jgi:hypothetical protein